MKVLCSHLKMQDLAEMNQKKSIPLLQELDRIQKGKVHNVIEEVQAGKNHQLQLKEHTGLIPKISKS